MHLLSISGLNVVVWNKTNAGQGSFYRSQHELIFVFKHGSGAYLNNMTATDEETSLS